VIALGMDLFGLVAEEVRWFNSSIPIAYNTVFPALIIVMFLLGLDRAAGLAAVRCHSTVVLHVAVAPAELALQAFASS
jgi:hypothetical protein